MDDPHTDDDEVQIRTCDMSHDWMILSENCVFVIRVHILVCIIVTRTIVRGGGECGAPLAPHNVNIKLRKLAGAGIMNCL